MNIHAWLAPAILFALLLSPWNTPANARGEPVQGTTPKTITGRVQWPDNKPAAGAVITWKSTAKEELFELDLFGEHRTTSAADGSFTIKDLGKGPYRIEVSARVAKDPIVYYAIAPSAAVGTTALALTLKPGASISGRVVDEKGQPVKAFEISAVQRHELPDGSGFSSAVNSGPLKDADGKFVLQGLWDGEWSVTATVSPTSLSKAVTVRVPTDTKPIELRIAHAASISGRVVDPKGVGVAGARVELQAGGELGFTVIGGDNRHADTDKDGAFTFPDVKAGKFKLTARAKDWGKSENVLVEVKGSESRTDVVISLRVAGNLKGEVVDANGKPVANCTVSPMLDDDDDFMNSPTATTNAKGEFELTGLAPGHYDVLAFTEKTHPSGKLEGSVQTDVVAGQTATVSIKVK